MTSKIPSCIFIIWPHVDVCGILVIAGSATSMLHIVVGPIKFCTVMKKEIQLFENDQACGQAYFDLLIQ